jgi:pantoate kinase
METLNIIATESELAKYSIDKSELTLSEFVKLIQLEMSKNALKESVRIAEETGLSKMTLEEINDEIKAVREHAKSNNRH